MLSFEGQWTVFSVISSQSGQHHPLCSYTGVYSALWCSLVVDCFVSLDTQSYVLNFHGRVTQASVKNFQIVHNSDGTVFLIFPFLFFTTHFHSLYSHYFLVCKPVRPLLSC